MKNLLRRRECGDITINSKHTKCICLFFSGSTGWKMTKRSKKEEKLIITLLRAPIRDPRSASLRQSDLSVSWVGLCFRVGMFCSCTKRACGCFVICDALFCCSSLRGNFSFVLGMGRMVTKSSRTEFYICGREGRFFLEGCGVVCQRDREWKNITRRESWHHEQSARSVRCNIYAMYRSSDGMISCCL